jgi:hypothetical protein
MTPAFADSAITLGQPLLLTVTLTWPELPTPILILPELKSLPNHISLDTINAQQSKVWQNGTQHSQMTYTFMFRPHKSGADSLQGIAFQYRHGESLERIQVPAMPYWVSKPVKIPQKHIGLVVLLLLLAITILYVVRMRKDKQQQKISGLQRLTQLEEHLLLIEKQMPHTAPVEILRKLESLSLQVSDLNPHSTANDDWQRMQQDFKAAHFDGGQRDVFTLKEHIKTIRACLQVQ